jgi:F420-0:gamma-glutamyl ligase
MIVRPIKTRLVKAGDSLTDVIANSIASFPEESVLVITSKIVSFCENQLVPKKTNTKRERTELVEQIADYYIPPHMSKYRIMLTRYLGMLMIDAGVDVTNSDNQYTLLPKDPQRSVNEIWKFLKENYRLKKVGVIMTDSFPALPLVWGTVSIPLAHCGFKTLKNYAGKQDLFGWEMHLPIINLSQGIAVAAGLEMGEGAEQTPLAVVSEITDIEFQNRIPTDKEIEEVKVDIKDDLYAPFLQAVSWKKGKNKLI